MLKIFISKVFVAIIALCVITSLISLIIIMNKSKETLRSDKASVQAFWPNLKNDLTRITWSHAVNSKRELIKAINDDEPMMLEADVTLGSLIGAKSTIPIMAHPPDDQSDLSLETFVNTVSKAVNKVGRDNAVKKGIKLDFKSLDVVEPSFIILNKLNEENKLTFPMWINADIAQGPGSTSKPVDPQIFLSLCLKYFPNVQLSLGWTSNAGTHKYEQIHINDMVQILSSAGIKGRSSITFAVRAKLAADSIPELQDLLMKSGDNSTLTIWSHITDNVDFKNLAKMIKVIGYNKIFLDIPPNQEQSLRSQF